MLSNLADINRPDLLVGLTSANLTFKPSLDVIIERLREALDDGAECRGLITRKLAP